MLKKIVITGGPCAGKTTALATVKDTFAGLGYTVLTVAETATELITGGVSPQSCGTNVDYQTCQLQLQLAKERVFLSAAATMPKDKILIVCDRGAMDNKAYMTDAEFVAVLHKLGCAEAELCGAYDAVFHLVSAAKGAEAFYTTANNAARTEGIAEAARLDDRLISCWSGHPYFKVIDNSDTFAEKINRLIAEIKDFLGE